MSFKEGYALVVGIADYPHIRKLPSTVTKDARDVVQTLTDATKCGYISEHVQHLYDDEATADKIRKVLNWLAKETGKKDTVIFYFSGHGGRIESGLQAGNYLLPFDVKPNDLKQTAISGDELTNLLKNIKASRLLALFDCCYSGGTGDVKDLIVPILPEFKSGLEENYYERLGQGQGRVIVASSRMDETSLILPGMDNSLFTHYFLRALRGEASSREAGLLGIFDIYDYVSKLVPQHDSRQHPVFTGRLENNFPIALHLGGSKGEDSTILPNQIPSVSSGNKAKYITYGDTIAPETKKIEKLTINKK